MKTDARYIALQRLVQRVKVNFDFLVVYALILNAKGNKFHN